MTVLQYFHHVNLEEHKLKNYKELRHLWYPLFRKLTRSCPNMQQGHSTFAHPNSANQHCSIPAPSTSFSIIQRIIVQHAEITIVAKKDTPAISLPQTAHDNLSITCCLIY